MTNIVSYIRQLANVCVDGNESGLISAWNMHSQNGNVLDQIGGNDGTIDGTLHDQYTSLGRGLHFNGVSELDLGTDSSLSISNGSITFSFWCRFDSIAAFQALVSKGTTANNQNYYVRVNNGQLQFYFRNVGDTSNIVFSTTDSPIAINKVYHIVLTHTFGNGSLTKFYVNGVNRPGTWSSPPGDDLPYTSVFAAFIGSRNANSQLNGEIIAVKFFNVHQNQIWVTQEYNRGKSSLWTTAYGANISASPTTGGNIENTPFRVINGSYQISSYSINGITAKVFECVTAGKLEIVSGFYHNNNSDSVYGDYELWIEKAAGHTTKIGCINQQRDNVANGYGFQILTDGTTTIEEWGVGSVVTGGSLTPGILAKLNLKRRAFDNQFEGFINGTSFGIGTDATIIKSYYTIFECGVGDKIVIADRNGGHAFVKRLIA